MGPASVPRSPGDDPLGALKARVKQARFPMLSANLRSKAAPTKLQIPRVARSTMLRVAGVRVGVVGAMTEAALTATHAANVRTLVVIPLAKSVEAEARALRRRGAKVVIAVVHAGGDCERVDDPEDLRSCETDSELFRLAHALPKGLVDVLIGGHTHAAVAHRVAGMAVIESLANGRAFGRVDLHIDREHKRVVDTKIFAPTLLCTERLDRPACVAPEYEGAPVARSAAVAAAVAPFLQAAKQKKQEPLGVLVTTPVRRSSARESALNNLVADMMLQALPGVDASLNNGGAVRVDLPAGRRVGDSTERIERCSTLRGRGSTTPGRDRCLAPDAAVPGDVAAAIGG